MTAQLNHLVAKQKLADLTRSAEWARLTQQPRPSVRSTSRSGWISRLLTPHRPRVTRQPTA
jgi:hypothetical protein